MGWGRTKLARAPVTFAPVEPEPVEWARLVTLDFETYYDSEYTLRKLTTSEYIRDPRFKAQMVGIKIGTGPTKVYPAAKIKSALAAIPWATHSLLAHHAQFDGFILSHHYGIHPKKIYCTMSMARGLYSNDIGAGLHEVSIFCGGQGKTDADSLVATAGVRDWPPALVKRVTPYCAGDVDECFRCFKYMLPYMPRDEIDIIDVTCKMFTDPVLKVDIPRVTKERDRELAVKRALMLSVAELAKDEKLDKKAMAELGPNPSEEDIAARKARKLIGSARFADVLRAEGIEPPVKVSPAWMKLSAEERLAKADSKWAYAFAKTDIEFIKLQEHPNERVRELVEARLSSKSNGNVTRAGRFLTAGANGASLPVYYKYATAISLRWGGGNGMNMQNLKRGGELRKSVLAPPGHVICVEDSGQIEARVNAWLWEQEDLLNDFRISDAFIASQAKFPKAERKVATGKDRDPYCKFAETIYGREITTLDDLERFVGKVGILGLGYQMGAARLQNTLALGSMGPAVHLDIEVCKSIVYAYRRKCHKIRSGWERCQNIIEQMAAGFEGEYKCVRWSKDTLYLPNGMTMRYPNLRDKRQITRVANKLLNVPDEFDPEEQEWEGPNYIYDDSRGNEVKLYGGKLCENIVQALARIIVATQLLMISRKERVVMTTHDEVAALAKKARADKVQAFMHECFKIPPAWCADIPLNAEGKYDVYYSK
jgi:hypothetical protein